MTMAGFTYLLLSLLLSLCFHHVCSLVPSFRKATSNDVFLARKILVQEAMNPISISTRTLLVAHYDQSNAMIGFGQIRPLNIEYSELASLYVLPDYRQQGVGSALVKELLARHEDDTKVCLLTLKPTMSFYEMHGFVCIKSLEDLPSILKFEFKVGSLISSFLGNDLVCMVR